MRTATAFRHVALARPAHVPSSLPPRGGFLWWRRGDGFAAHGRAATVTVSDDDRFDRAADELGTFFAAAGADGADAPAPLAVGSFAFDARAGGSLLVVPEVVVRRETVTVFGDADAPPVAHEPPPPAAADRARYAGAEVDEVAWLEGVAAAIDEIAAGRLAKVVLARDQLVWSRTPFDERRVAARLIERFPECHTFACGGLVGASPELLVRKTGRNVESLVLAGSARRGRDADEDRELGLRMLASAKEREEHALAVASVVDELRPLCGELTVEEAPSLLRLANVQHLATRVRGSLAESLSVLNVVGALHPTAAVCGVPRTRALDLIRRVEGCVRGRYAGPVGWVDANGDGEWAIALRCAQIDGTRARLFAGAGIVAGSVAEDELEETRLKLRAMQAALGAPSY